MWTFLTEKKNKRRTLLQLKKKKKVTLQTTLVSAVCSHAPRHNKTSIPLPPPGDRVSKPIWRAAAETTEARVLLLLPLCSWPGGRGNTGAADGKESHISKGPFLGGGTFFPPWLTGSRHRQAQHTGVYFVCVRVAFWTKFEQCNKASSVCVCVFHIRVTSGEPHALFSSPPDPTRVCQTAQQSSACACL